MISSTDQKILDILIEAGKVSDDNLELANSEHARKKKPVLEFLLESGGVSQEDVAQARSQVLGIPFFDLRGFPMTEELVALCNVSVLRKHNVLPVGLDGPDCSVVILAMADPLDMEATDDIAMITGRAVEPRIATQMGINAVLDKFYGTDEAMSAAEQYATERQARTQQVEEDEEIANGPIVQIVRSIIEQAVRQRASDIHIDAQERRIVVRFRIDSVMTKVMTYDTSLLSAIVTRIKIMGNMDISEKRKAQDGHISTNVDGIDYDIRVSILPTSFGEKVVLRIATSMVTPRSKSELGMRPWDMDRFDQLLANTNGIILVTGPTGSGKSTTLYSALSELNDESINIITVEDPVEANINGINQVQVNNKADLTFANALRAILRQDPDIIMIGEIRDYETASIAIQASITGHLVFSTLHTNSAAASITRLLDMGSESYLLADSVVGIIAQRLIRVLCPDCKKKRKATKGEKTLLRVPVDKPLDIYERGGCPHCSNTGYFGRIGVYEILQMSPELKRLVAEKANTETIRKQAEAEGMHSLREAATEYVLEGKTTISEMFRVAQLDDEEDRRLAAQSKMQQRKREQE